MTYVLPLVLLRKYPRKIPAILFSGIAVLYQFVYFLRLKFGKTTLSPDVRTVWHPLAKSIIEGQVLYVDVWDNKPPLFEYINIAVEATGYYIPVFFLLIAIANAATAFGIYYFASNYTGPGVASIAGIGFLVGIPATHGFILNVRSLSLPFIIAGLITSRSAYRGVFAGLAGLISQYSALALLIYIAHDFVTNRASIRREGKMILISVIVVAVGYLSLLLIWGPSAMIQGVETTVFSAGDYATTTKRGVVENPLRWSGWLLFAASKLLFLLLPALAALGVGYRSESDKELIQVATVGTVSLWLPILVNNLLVYWVFPLPFISLLAAVGLEGLIERDTDLELV